MSDQKLTLEVQNAIASCATDGNCLRLPKVQWPRDLYLEVKSALVKQGGKYQVGGKFTFKGDIGLKIGLMLNRGVAVDEKKKFQAFFTPRDVADEMAHLANVKGKWVLEPSAGKGALVEACARAGAAGISCIEINQEFVDGLKADGLTAVICKDFMKCRPARTLPCIVMNPPFSNKQDVKHVFHALDWLDDDGVLVSVMQHNHIDILTPKLGCLEWRVFEIRDDAYPVKTKLIQIRR